MRIYKKKIYNKKIQGMKNMTWIHPQEESNIKYGNEVLSNILKWRFIYSTLPIHFASKMFTLLLKYQHSFPLLFHRLEAILISDILPQHCTPRVWLKLLVLVSVIRIWVFPAGFGEQTDKGSRAECDVRAKRGDKARHVRSPCRNLQSGTRPLSP